MKPFQYPFSAIVEQNAFKTALLLNAVDPSLGGVLIRKHKGIGKSTAARALARLLPHIEEDPTEHDRSGPPFSGPVELPLNATEDRLVGSDQIPSIFIDAGAQKQSESDMSRIARIMGASFIRVTDLTAASVLKATS